MERLSILCCLFEEIYAVYLKFKRIFLFTVFFIPNLSNTVKKSHHDPCWDI